MVLVHGRWACSQQEYHRWRRCREQLAGRGQWLWQGRLLSLVLAPLSWLQSVLHPRWALLPCRWAVLAALLAARPLLTCSLPSSSRRRRHRCSTLVASARPLPLGNSSNKHPLGLRPDFLASLVARLPYRLLAHPVLSVLGRLHLVLLLVVQVAPWAW